MSTDRVNYSFENFTDPLFITFEGTEGSGKSTQSKLLYQFLQSKGIEAVYTREVGGTPDAEKIRDFVVNGELFPISELLLIMAARYEHINKVIVPALLDGKWVICDRFIDSTVAYQSEESGLGSDEIFALHKKLMTYTAKLSNEGLGSSKFTKAGLLPDITFFMDLPPSISVKRARARGQTNRFDERALEFHEATYRRFKDIAYQYKQRFKIIKVEGKDEREISEEIINYLF